MKEVTYIIADRQRLFTEGLKLLIEKTDGYKTVATCENETDLFAFLHKLKPDILLIDLYFSQDLSMLIKRVYETIPSQKIIVLSAEKDTDRLFDIYKGGIAGFILKTSGSAVLDKVLKTVTGGGQYIEPVVIPGLKDKIDSMEAEKKKKGFLTNRELQILQYVAQGLYNKEIAYNLGITEKTVKNHITHLFKKIGVEDRIQAAVFALKNGYIYMD